MHPFEAKLARAWPPDRWQKLGVVVGVSGGADSVALLRGLSAAVDVAKDKLVIAHLNHQLRGVASDRDEAFVAGLGERLGLRTEVHRVNVAMLAQQEGVGIEEAARYARYKFFQDVAERVGVRYVAVAHTLSDQAETILYRILRGTSLAGLAGIPRVRALSAAVSLVRPLLEFKRAEVLTYLDSLQQGYVEDESNSDLHYMRNRIRRELLPTLERDYQRGAGAALVRLGNLAAELQTLIEPLVAAAMERCVTFASAYEIRIDCNRLAEQPRYLVREVLVQAWRKQGWSQQAMGFAQWEELASLVLRAHSPVPMTAAQMFPESVQAQKKGEQLTLTRLM